MAKPMFPYKPELSKEKANLFTRCFIYCINSPDCELSEEEQGWLLHFVGKVGEKTFVEDHLRPVKTQDEKDWDAIQERLAANKAANKAAPDVQRIRPPGGISSYNPESDQGQEHPDYPQA